MSVTTLPSKATCANCLTAMRYNVTGVKKQFKSSHARDIDSERTQ
jgi:hypothetical protein